jgi:shikimate dehydrogenase
MPIIDATTRVCALLGHPVGHSLSPAIHNAAFEALNLPFVYVAHDVTAARLADSVRGAASLGYRGLSITIPHKMATLSLVDHVDVTARAIGCVNTVVCEDDGLWGRNSDGLGALNALRAAEADPGGRTVLLLGSGGAARALAMTLAIEAPPRQLRILGIEPPELEQLVSDVAAIGSTSVQGGALDPQTLEASLADADLLLQATPVGMAPNTEQTLVPPAYLRPGLVVFDAVYNPRRTRLLLDATRHGCRVVEGLEMFLGQAAVQFELWTGHRAPLGVMRQILEAAL